MCASGRVGTSQPGPDNRNTGRSASFGIGEGADALPSKICLMMDCFIDNDCVIIYAIWLGKLITRDAWSAHVRRTAMAQFTDHRGEFMTITISNLNVNANAPFGTTVAVLTAIDTAGNIVPANFILTKTSTGYFTVSSNSINTAWQGSIAPGYYSVRVRAYYIDGGYSTSATFAIAVTPVA